MTTRPTTTSDMDDADHPQPNPIEALSGRPAMSWTASEAQSPRRGGSRRDAPDRLTFETSRAPETTDAWLQVVSGPSAAHVARGALELVAHFLVAGQRVLIVDGGPRLRLHDRFDREARWGVIECLTGEMPVLGLVQEVGRPGLYLLAHGLPAPRTHWGELGRLLEEARPHFGRVVLALDHDTPAAAGAALAGWHLEGWWAGGNRLSSRAGILADHLGIHFADLDLKAIPDAELEALDARVTTLSLVRVTQVDPAPPAADRPPIGVPADPPEAPLTLECNAQVRERLRFLLWMRRVRNEGRAPDAARPTASPTPRA